MARRCVRYKRTAGGRRCAKYSGTKKGYRGYGQPVKVYSGFGALDIGLDAFLPPMVGGGTALATSALLRAFVDPEVKENDTIKVDDEGNPVVHWAFKYAGLLGAGGGIVTSMVLGPFMGWGAAAAGAITSLFAGGAAQLYNTVVPEERQGYRGYGRYGLVAMQPRHYGRFPATHSPVYGKAGYGAVGALPTQRRFALPGRGAQGIPESVRAVVNRSAFGGSPTLGTRL